MVVFASSVLSILIQKDFSNLKMKVFKLSQSKPNSDLFFCLDQKLTFTSKTCNRFYVQFCTISMRYFKACFVVCFAISFNRSPVSCLLIRLEILFTNDLTYTLKVWLQQLMQYFCLFTHMGINFQLLFDGCLTQNMILDRRTRIKAVLIINFPIKFDSNTYVSVNTRIIYM